MRVSLLCKRGYSRSIDRLTQKLMNAYPTDPIALLPEYSVEPWEGNEQLQGTVVHVSCVGMQRIWTLQWNVPTVCRCNSQQLPISRNVKLMTEPESSLKCLFIYILILPVSLCTKQLYFIKITNTSHSSDYKKTKLNGILTVPCACSHKIIWFPHFRVKQSTGCIRKERHILPVHLISKVFCIFIFTFQVGFPTTPFLVDYFSLMNFILCIFLQYVSSQSR